MKIKHNPVPKPPTHRYRCVSIGFALEGKSDNKAVVVGAMSWHANRLGFSFWLEKAVNNKWQQVVKYNKRGKRVKI